MTKKAPLRISDTLEGLFFYLAEYDRSSGQLDSIFIPCSTPFFHKIIYRLARRKKYRIFFSGILWQQRIFGFYGEEIESALSSLVMSRMLSRAECFGPKDHSCYLIEKKLTQHWKKYYRKMYEKQSALLRNLALDFIKETDRELERGA